MMVGILCDTMVSSIWGLKVGDQVKKPGLVSVSKMELDLTLLDHVEI